MFSGVVVYDRGRVAACLSGVDVLLLAIGTGCDSNACKASIYWQTERKKNCREMFRRKTALKVTGVTYRDIVIYTGTSDLVLTSFNRCWMTNKIRRMRLILHGKSLGENKLSMRQKTEVEDQSKFHQSTQYF